MNIVDGGLVKRFALTVCLLLISSCVAGCASFRGNHLAEIDQVVARQPVAENVSIRYELRRFNKPIVKEGAAEFSLKQKEFIAAGASRSELFRNVSHLEAEDGAAPGFVLRYKLNNYGNELLSFISGFISGYSLLVIPGVAIDKYTLTAELMSPQGDTVWRKAYKDSVTTIFWLPFIPLMFSKRHQNVNVTQEMLHNMYRYPLKDIAEERIELKPVLLSGRSE